MQSTWSIFPLWLVFFVSHLKISFLTSRSLSYSPVLSSRSATVLHVGQKPTMYWLILYTVSEAKIKRYFFPSEYPMDSALCVKKTIFHLLLYCVTLVLNQVSIYARVILGYFIPLVYLFTLAPMSHCPNYCGFIISHAILQSLPMMVFKTVLTFLSLRV